MKLDEPPTIPVPLGPGDDDPQSPPRHAPPPATPPVEEAVPEPPPIPLALKPGDAVGANPDDAFDILIPLAPGPGATPRTRHLVRIPKPVEAVKEQHLG